MMYRISKLERLRKSDWLKHVSGKDWHKVLEPSSEESQDWGIQELELKASASFGRFKSEFGDAFKTLAKKNVYASDGVLAMTVHRMMNGTTIREARDPGLWAYLAVFGSPSYVKWRWQQSVTVRFAGNIRRNALARLWWWAQVTYDPTKDLDDPRRYAPTLVTDKRSDFILYAGDCAFSGNRGILLHLSNLQQKKAKGSKDQQRLCRAINRIARVTCLDSLDADSQTQTLCEQAYTISQKLS
jgi:hypothetical protein